jgi:DNA-binding response OmpR family regulator
MSRKVLVADDEPLTADMLALLMAFYGYDVVCAHDGAEALAAALAEKPDLLLLDVRMPGLEGLAVARRLRQEPEFADRPVVLFSSVDESEVEWREAGADLFLQTPLDVRALGSVVAALLPAETEPGAQPLDGLLA